MKKLLLITVMILLTFSHVSALSKSEQINSANYLASKSYIQDSSGTIDDYRINDNITRKEVMKIIANIANLSAHNTCEGKFKDVENDWGCKYIEVALYQDFIEHQDNFRPNDYITVNEILKLIFKAKNIQKKYDTGYWGKDYLDTAKDLGLILDENIDGNTLAKRGFIFSVTANTFGDFEQYQIGKNNVLIKENNIDTYGINFNLKIITPNKYELIGENIPNDINSIEILSCKDNYLDTYDSKRYNLKSFQKGNSTFKYVIDRNLNNYCIIPYKVKLNYLSGDFKTIDINTNLIVLKKFTYENIYFSGSIDYINLNSFKVLMNDEKEGQFIDKNNLYMYYNGWPEAYAYVYKIKDYLSYKYVGDILIGDNFQYEIIPTENGNKGISLDGKSFEDIGTGYYKDKDNYYQQVSWGKLNLIGKNTKKFDIILSSSIYNYDGVYYIWGDKFEIGDLNSFELVFDDGEHDKELQYNLTIFSIFAKDKDNLYFNTAGYWADFYKVLKGDYASYTILSDIIAVDKNHIFYINEESELLQYPHTFDLATLKLEKDNTFSDKNGYYYLDLEKGIIKK